MHVKVLPTKIIMLSYIGGRAVTHHTAEPKLPGSIPGSDQDFHVSLFAMLLLQFYLFGEKPLFVKM